MNYITIGVEEKFSKTLFPFCVNGTVTIIKEFFNMKDGGRIDHPNDYILLTGTIRIKRRVLKHVIEARKADGYSVEKIAVMMERASLALKSPDFLRANHNKTYPGSLLCGKIYPGEEDGLLVIYMPNGEMEDVINLYYREIQRYKRLF